MGLPVKHAVVKVCVLLLLCIVNGTPCPPCPEDFYQRRDCTLTKGTECAICSKCDGEGQKILSNCTRVTDTQCGCEDGWNTSIHGCEKVTTPPTSPSTPPKIMTTPSTRNHFQRVTMLGAVPVFLAFVLIILALNVLFLARISFKPWNQTKLDRNGGRILDLSLNLDKRTKKNTTPLYSSIIEP